MIFIKQKLSRLHALCCVVILLLLVNTRSISSAQVTVQEPESMEALMQRYRDHRPLDAEVSGWCILIGLDSDRRKIDERQRVFERKYHQYKSFVHWEFDNPNYKLTVGAFADDVSALPFLAKIRKDYRSAFQVKKTIRRSDILAFHKAMQL